MALCDPVLEQRPVSLERRQVIRLRGTLTATSAGHLLELLRTADPAPAEVELDLSRVKSIERSGAAILIDAYVATVLRRRAFALSGPSPTCRQSLECFGVLDVVTLIEQGIRGLAPRRTL